MSEPDSVRYHVLPMAGVEAMTARSARSFPRHTHDQYGVGVVDSGGHGSWSGRGPVEAGPGHFISVNPGEVHDGHALGGRARAWRILYFEPVALLDLVADISARDIPFEFCRPVFVDPSLRASFEGLFRHARDGADALACESAALELLAGLRSHDARRGRVGSTATPDLRRARDRLDSEPAKAHSLSELARDCSLSRYQLLRAFTRTFGLPPHAYLMQRRLALARQQLRSGAKPAEVAANTGFSDQSHLTRCFVRQFGVPPGRYRSATR